MNKVISITVLLFLMESVGAMSFGISPTDISFENVLPGTTISKQFAVNTDRDQELVCTIRVQGKIKDWITIEPINAFELTQPVGDFARFGDFMFRVSGRPSYILNLTIRVPEDAKKGRYTSSLYLRGSGVSGPEEVSGFGVGAGMYLDVDVGVTDEVIEDISIVGIEMRNVELGESPHLKLVLSNRGNVEVTPKLMIGISDSSGNSISSVESAAEPLDLAAKFVEVSAELPSDLDMGSYTADVKVYVGDEVIGEISRGFSVLRQGAYSEYGEIAGLLLDRREVSVDEPVKVTSVFSNIGAKPVTARFVARVLYRGDVIDTIIGGDKRVNTGENVTFVVYYTPRRDGEYTISGRFDYLDKSTIELETKLKVETLLSDMLKKRGFVETLLEWVRSLFYRGV